MRSNRCISRFSIIVVVFFILAYISYGNYKSTTKIIKSEHEAKHKLVEESIFNTIKYADAINQIAENELSEKMMEISISLVDKYRQDSDIFNWNLEELKNKFGNYEIYIIDKSLTVIMTTFKPDLGINFKQYQSFSKILQSRLQGNSFVSDRVDISINTGKLMKYSYMPTPDHRYIFELSTNIDNNIPIINNSDIFSVAGKLEKQYPFINNILIYKFDGDSLLKISKNKPFYTKIENNDKEAHVKKAFGSNQVQIHTVTNPSTNTTLTYKYFAYLTTDDNLKSNWWNSYVIEIVYDDSVMLEALNNSKISFLKDLLIITIVYFSFVFIILYLLHKFEHMAYHDHLTNLPNRKLFEKSIDQKIIDAKNNIRKLAVLFIDLNNFKNVNDTLGHNVGDKLLEEVAKRLRSNLRQGDVVSRLGGDEFTVLLLDVESSQTAVKVTSKINDIFKEPIKIYEHEILIKPSIGISLYPEDGHESECLMKKADIAMYHAKKQNLNYVLYSEGIQEN